MKDPNSAGSLHHLLAGSYADRLAKVKELRLDTERRNLWAYFDDLITQLQYLQGYSPRPDLDYVSADLLKLHIEDPPNSTFVHTCTLVPPDHVPCLYDLAWEACVEKCDIRYLHLVSRLGNAKYQRIDQLFQGDVFKKRHDVSNVISFNEPLAEETIAPSHRVAEANLRVLQHKNDTFWLQLLNGYTLSLRIGFADASEIVREYSPAFSVIAGDAIGSFIGHVYKVEHQAVVPIYADAARSLVAILLLDPKVSLVSSTKKVQQWKAIEIIETMIEQLRDILWRSPITTGLAAGNERYLVPCGAMNNYGHTVINESAVYNVLADNREQLIHNNIYPMICDKDFLDSLNVLRRSWSDEEILLLEEATIKSAPSIHIVDGIVIPLASYLPTTQGLKACWSSCSENDRKDNRVISNSILPKAVYWSIGGRNGARECNNVIESVSFIAALLAENNIFHLVLDSHTCIPRYLRQRETSNISTCLAKHYNERYLALLSDIDNSVSRFGISVVDINACTFRQKAAICKLFDISFSVAPYGSSSMFPIYFLNNNVLLTGSEVFSAHLEAWKWHVTSCCHSKRHHEEFYVKSSVTNSSGYRIDIEILANTVREVLSGAADH